jgi:hypothetical protein
MVWKHEDDSGKVAQIQKQKSKWAGISPHGGGKWSGFHRYLKLWALTDEWGVGEPRVEKQWRFGTVATGEAAGFDSTVPKLD